VSLIICLTLALLAEPAMMEKAGIIVDHFWGKKDNIGTSCLWSSIAGFNRSLPFRQQFRQRKMYFVCISGPISVKTTTCMGLLWTINSFLQSKQ
jgi:hypothetical protein